MRKRIITQGDSHITLYWLQKKYSMCSRSGLFVSCLFFFFFFTVVKEAKGQLTALKVNRRGEWGIPGRGKPGGKASDGEQAFLCEVAGRWASGWQPGSQAAGFAPLLGEERASPFPGSPQPLDNKLKCLPVSALPIFFSQLDKVEEI